MVLEPIYILPIRVEVVLYLIKKTLGTSHVCPLRTWTLSTYMNEIY